MFKSLSDLRKTNEGYETKLLNSNDVLYSNTINYESVQLNFEPENLRKKKEDDRKLIDINNLTLSIDRSDEIKNIPKPINTHPNDPSLDINPNQYQQQQVGPMYNQYIQPIVPNYQNSYWYQQQKAREYQAGYNYIQNRGPVYYNFPNNPYGISVLKKFQDDMNQKINDPSQVLNGKYNPNNQLGDSIIPVDEISAEEYRDKQYERENKQREEIAKTLKEKREFAVPKEIDKNSIPQRKMSHKERIEKMNNTNTPMTDIDKIGNHVLPSGETVFRLSSNPNNQLFSNDESSNAFELAKKRYEEEKRAILGRSPLVYQPYNQPRFYNPNDYTNYVNNNYLSRPYYSYGYGYSMIGGNPDVNGLPTVYFDDNGRYLSPTQQEIDEEKVPVIYFRGKSKPLKKQKIINTNPGRIIKFYSEVINGKLVKKISDSINGKWSDKEIEGYYKRYGFRDYKFAATGVNPEPANNTYYENYSNMFQDAVDQNNEDDTAVMCLELSRYNKELSYMYGWLRNILEPSDFILLKHQCLDFLYDVRNIDVFCLIKSSVVISKNQLISLKSKPTDDNELLNLSNEFEHVIENVLKRKAQYTNKLDIISVKLNSIISIIRDTTKSTKDKVEFLKKLRNIELIPVEENKAFKYAQKIMETIPDYKKANYIQYSFWKSIKVKSTLESEKSFSEWWNKPRRRMTKNEYEKAYNYRMQELSMNYLDYIQKNNLGYDPEVVQRNAAAYNEWVRLSEGLFNKPIKTFADYIKACNVTQYNIDRENLFRQQIEEARKRKTDVTPSQQCILDKVIEKNTERMGFGESFVQKMPRYTPVSLTGIGDDIDVETRRKRFIERIFKSVKRPSIT